MRSLLLKVGTGGYRAEPSRASSEAALDAAALVARPLGADEGADCARGPLAALVVVTTANLALQREEQQERASGRAATALTNDASQVLADAVNAETSVRGFAASSDPIFLAPYNQALSRVAADEAALRRASKTEGDAGQ